MAKGARALRYPHDTAPDHGTAIEVAEGILDIIAEHPDEEHPLAALSAADDA